MEQLVALRAIPFKMVTAGLIAVLITDSLGSRRVTTVIAITVIGAESLVRRAIRCKTEPANRISDHIAGSSVALSCRDATVSIVVFCPFCPEVQTVAASPGWLEPICQRTVDSGFSVPPTIVHVLARLGHATTGERLFGL
jgi:hypothetical protein